MGCSFVEPGGAVVRADGSFMPMNGPEFGSHRQRVALGNSERLALEAMHSGHYLKVNYGESVFDYRSRGEAAPR